MKTRRFCCLPSRTIPCRVEFAVPDIGETVWFAFRWVGHNGKAGPWSDFYSQVIPA